MKSDKIRGLNAIEMVCQLRNCGAPLTDDAEKEINSVIDDAINYINQNPDFREFYKEYQNFLNAKKEYERITT